MYLFAWVSVIFLLFIALFCVGQFSHQQNINSAIALMVLNLCKNTFLLRKCLECKSSCSIIFLICHLICYIHINENNCTLTKKVFYENHVFLVLLLWHLDCSISICNKCLLSLDQKVMFSNLDTLNVWCENNPNCLLYKILCSDLRVQSYICNGTLIVWSGI